MFASSDFSYARSGVFQNAACASKFPEWHLLPKHGLGARAVAGPAAIAVLFAANPSTAVRIKPDALTPTGT
jgi:hypothetical protein